MERRAAVVTASVISASVLAASTAMAVASGVFDSPSGSPEPEPIFADAQVAGTPTTVQIVPEVVTVFVDPPAVDSPPVASAGVPGSPGVATSPNRSIDDHGDDFDDHGDDFDDHGDDFDDHGDDFDDHEDDDGDD